MAQSLSAPRRALYSGLVFALFLLVFEGVLALVPTLYGEDMEPPDGDFVLCIGDSVTAGVGLGAGQSWPERLEERLSARGVPVLRRAVPGARIPFLSNEALESLEELPSDATPVVLVLLGHNDEVRIEPGAGTLLRKNRFEQRGESTSGWKGPRILRLVRWAGSDGSIERAGADWLREAWALHLPPLVEAVEARGGEVLLLSYLVPGTPTVLSEDEAAVVDEVRSAQAVVNASIRHAARGQGLGLIDLEALIEVGDEWNSDQWIDHIHPDVPLTIEIAAAVESAISRAE